MNTKAARFHIGLVAQHWYQDEHWETELESLQQQSAKISITFQQNYADIIVSDLHILEQIRDSRMHDTKVINKKVRYANGFGKMKKALNIALDLGCEEELINMITRFINLMTFTENNNNESNPFEVEEMIVLDPLVIKHCEWPLTKRLKSSSELQDHKGLVHNYQAMNPQDSNIRMPLSNINTNNTVINLLITM
ncbi:180_t:CDS:1 [Gigaspora margarita]|uniref:180_t:CDS:1 n=1 Tax=Gigaspora margarita TaxID=4874 RepID=A0ABN7X8G3_GIGMA|nr:180_t:CDS:1 [Gigaspora margarita]